MKRTIDTTKKLVSLTFDDGPNLTTTAEMLDVLEKYHVVGSFFLIGQNINEETAKMSKRAYDMGCDIQNHSKTHGDMTKLSAEEIAAEIAFTSAKIKEITGEEPQFFRPPFILVNDTMYDTIDMPFICGAGCNDWEPDCSAEKRVEMTMNNVKDGALILLHDMPGNTNTVQAIDVIIPKLLEQGYEFVTVTEMFEAKGVPIKGGSRQLYTYL